jgi:hypothetical protein
LPLPRLNKRGWSTWFVCAADLNRPVGLSASLSRWDHWAERICPSGLALRSFAVSALSPASRLIVPDRGMDSSIARKASEAVSRQRQHNIFYQTRDCFVRCMSPRRGCRPSSKPDDWRDIHWLPPPTIVRRWRATIDQYSVIRVRRAEAESRDSVMDLIKTQLIESVFAGGGEMGASMRALDWSTTILGPLEQWPQSLRACVWATSSD